eukprot:3455408-Rhodomonas_salina.7
MGVSTTAAQKDILVAIKTKLRYPPTRVLCDARYNMLRLSDYALAMRCPVLPERMVLRLRCAMSGTEIAYAGTRRRKL